MRIFFPLLAVISALALPAWANDFNPTAQDNANNVTFPSAITAGTSTANQAFDNSGNYTQTNGYWSGFSLGFAMPWAVWDRIGTNGDFFAHLRSGTTFTIFAHQNSQTNWFGMHGSNNLTYGYFSNGNFYVSGNYYANGQQVLTNSSGGGNGVIGTTFPQPMWSSSTATISGNQIKYIGANGQAISTIFSVVGGIQPCAGSVTNVAFETMAAAVGPGTNFDVRVTVNGVMSGDWIGHYLGTIQTYAVTNWTTDGTPQYQGGTNLCGLSVSNLNSGTTVSFTINAMLQILRTSNAQ